MSIINPAIEDQIYNCPESTWYLNGKPVISFSQGNTLFTKTIINGKPEIFSYSSFDDISNLFVEYSYVIQNPDNFDYSIYDDAFQCNLYLNHPIKGKCYCSYFSGDYLLFNSNYGKGITFNLEDNTYPHYGSSYIRFDGTKKMCYTTMTLGSLMVRASLKKGFDRSGWVESRSLVNGYQLHDQEKILENYVYCTSLPSTQATIIIERINPTKKLKIIDGNSIFIIDLNSGGINSDDNSIFNAKVKLGKSKVKYTFINDIICIEKLVDNDQSVSLKCGKDCPPDTCFKCRNIDYVCCYNNEGIATEMIYDPDKQIEAC